ncbi:50S ribosomal protein L2 [Candidatus Kaiserbacteria bacterium]|nr:50S ribosomal protein L2 [Candidatus Kaiserbacteria bacterium]
MKKYKPTSAGRRGASVIDYREKLSTTKNKPLKSLTKGKRSTGGRNSQGRITTHYRGAGNKRTYRQIDFKFDKKGVPAKIESIEYDPNRSGFIALVLYADGERRYILAPQDMKVGDTFEVSEEAKPKTGNRLPLGKIPSGTFVYNIELKPNAGARLVRSAGNRAEVVAHDSGYTQIRLPSTEIRKVISTAWATVGEVSNEEHQLVTIGKAGRARHMGLRPKTRGAARNPVDHPHGGGEGRSPRGHRRQRTKQGRPTGKGQKTRKPKKYSDRLIVSRRKPGKLMTSKK